MEKGCSVVGCKGQYDGWIDIFDNIEKVKRNQDRHHGRYPFCQKHFDIIMPYLDKKQKEKQEKENDFNSFYAWMPLSWVNEALNKNS